MSDVIGEKSALVQCEDCKQFFHFLECDRWCEDCFDKGLQKDMDDHFKNFIEQEMKEEGASE